MSVYTLAFREDEGSSRNYFGRERLDVAADLMATIGAIDGEALMVLPAGFAVASSQDERDQWAEAMAAVSRSAGVAVVFGIDAPEHERWGLEACPRSFAYASDRGRRLLWPIAPVKRAAELTRRTVTFDAARTTIVFARELLAGRAARTIAAEDPDLVVVLGHGQPTKRWMAPYRAMDALAPTLVVHQEFPVWRPLQLPPPRGWSTQTSHGPVSVVSYRREADGAMVRAVGN